jgi:hypothetical protein
VGAGQEVPVDFTSFGSKGFAGKPSLGLWDVGESHRYQKHKKCPLKSRHFCAMKKQHRQSQRLARTSS